MAKDNPGSFSARRDRDHDRREKAGEDQPEKQDR